MEVVQKEVREKVGFLCLNFNTLLFALLFFFFFTDSWFSVVLGLKKSRHVEGSNVVIYCLRSRAHFVIAIQWKPIRRFEERGKMGRYFWRVSLSMSTCRFPIPSFHEKEATISQISTIAGPICHFSIICGPTFKLLYPLIQNSTTICFIIHISIWFLLYDFLFPLWFFIYGKFLKFTFCIQIWLFGLKNRDMC